MVTGLWSDLDSTVILVRNQPMISLFETFKNDKAVFLASSRSIYRSPQFVVFLINTLSLWVDVCDALACCILVIANKML